MMAGDLSWEIKSGWKRERASKREIYIFSRDYMNFISAAKTEWEVIKESVKLLKEAGFEDYKNISKPSPGTKFYAINRERALIAGILGQRGAGDIRLVASHIDAPHLDLKVRPIYSDSGLTLLETHYYGGIKYYQWVNIPLSLHGVVCKEDGSRVDVIVGEKRGDPVFIIADLLPHLGRKTQGEKKINEAIPAENLDALAGTIPTGKDDKKALKETVLRILWRKFGIKEEDLFSASLQLVPAFPAASVGFDASMIAAYGQDDRICAYTSLQALLKSSGEATRLIFMADREEIGSEGATSAKSWFLLEVLEWLFGENPLKFLSNIKAVSADVTAAVNPNYKEVHDIKNAAFINHGVVITKFTGSGGKYHGTEATPEFVAWLRRIFNKHKVIWQASELGKVDEGGGGTVAKFLASYNMDVVDIGPPLLSMHSPYEISGKLDVYETFKAFKVFFSESL